MVASTAHARNAEIQTSSPSAAKWAEAVLLSPKLSCSAKVLGLAARWFVERHGRTPLGIELAEVAGFRSRQRLVEARAQLERAGFVVVERVEGRATSYSFAMEGRS